MSDRTPFNLRHLEGVAAIRRTRSFSAAASEINLTQSALTQAVAALERRLGRSLFDRNARGARATAAGDLLADSIERTLLIINDAGRDALPPTPDRGLLSRRATGTQLLALAVVERAGGFRGGARASGLTEASLHRAVRDLEATLGLELIARTGDGLEATPPAVVLARATRQAGAEVERGLEAARHGSGRVLVIGAMPLVRTGLLPSAMARLCADDPRVRFSVVEGSYADLSASLFDGRVDLLLGALRDRAPDGVVQHRLFDDDLVVVARSDHVLARTSGWSTSALTQYPWAASPPGTPRRDRWEKLFGTDVNAQVTPRVECSSASAIRGLLLHGDWLAMLSPDQFKIERELGILVALTGPLSIETRAIGFTVRVGWIADASQAAFLDVLQRWAAEQSAET